MTDHDDLMRLRVDEQIRDALKSIVDDQILARKEMSEIRPQLDHIERQVVLTNGRVTNIELWRAKSGGVMAAIAVIASLIGWLISQSISFFKS